MRVEITKDIIWDGEDAHPPMCLALCGDVVEIIHELSYGVLNVVGTRVHEIFKIYPGEYSKQYVIQTIK